MNYHVIPRTNQDLSLEQGGFMVVANVPRARVVND